MALFVGIMCLWFGGALGFLVGSFWGKPEYGDVHVWESAPLKPKRVAYPFIMSRDN